MKPKDENNIYLRVPLNQVKADALAGVSLACEAWRIRQPGESAKELGHVVEPKDKKLPVKQR
jgi:hypothetical protein